MPLTLPRLDPDVTFRPPPPRIAPAMRHVATTAGHSLAGLAWRLLRVPLGVLALACAVVGWVMAAHGMWLDAVTAWGWGLVVAAAEVGLFLVVRPPPVYQGDGQDGKEW